MGYVPSLFRVLCQKVLNYLDKVSKSMRLINLLITDPISFFLGATLFIYSVVIHEVAHGWVAYRMGDPTAKWMGRLSLNPLKHLDPFGTLMLFLVGFGWAKPVPVNINNIPITPVGSIVEKGYHIKKNNSIIETPITGFDHFKVKGA